MSKHLVEDVASTRSLRVAVNFGNALLTARDDAGRPHGLVIDLAAELARRLELAVTLVPYEQVGAIARDAGADVWDVAFLACDPDRALEISFTPPYLLIEATYLVAEESTLRSVADVDRDGIRVAVSGKSAYDLYLSRTLRRARVVRAASMDDSIVRFREESLDALAGLRPQLMTIAEHTPGTRVLHGGFTTIEQAIGLPVGRSGAGMALRAFVYDITSSGFVASLIRKHQVRGVGVPSTPPPPAIGIDGSDSER